MGRLWTGIGIARELGIPESTVRWYAKHFAAYLPRETVGRQQRFRAEALPVFRTIRESFQTGMSQEEVQLLLEGKVGRPAAQLLQAREEATAAHRATTAIVREIRDLVGGIRNEVRREHILWEGIPGELERLHQQVESLTRQMTAWQKQRADQESVQVHAQREMLTTLTQVVERLAQVEEGLRLREKDESSTRPPFWRR